MNSAREVERRMKTPMNASCVSMLEARDTAMALWVLWPPLEQREEAVVTASVLPDDGMTLPQDPNGHTQETAPASVPRLESPMRMESLAPVAPHAGPPVTMIAFTVSHHQGHVLHPHPHLHDPPRVAPMSPHVLPLPDRLALP